MKTRKTLIFTIISLFILSLSFGSQATQPEQKLKKNLADKLLFEPIPAPIEKFYGTDSEHSINDFAGKVLMINFWATWCLPCKQEMPALNNLAEYFKKQNLNLELITISEDFKGIETAENYLKQNNLHNLKPYVDKKNHLYNAFKISGLPVTIFINTKGYEVARVEGARDWNSEEWQDEIAKLVKKLSESN